MEATGRSRSIVPIKCALRYKPPVLILVYKDEATGKVRRRSMPLRGFNSNTDITLYMEELKKNRNRQYINAIPETQLLSLLKKVKHAQEQIVPEIGSPQEIILASLQDLPSLPASSRSAKSAPLSVKVQNADDGDEIFLLTRSARPKGLDEKFNLALNELLKDEDSDTTPERKGLNSPEHQHGSAPVKWPPIDTNQKYNPFSTDSLLNSKKAPLDSSPEKSSEGNSRNISVEIPDYSPDFNSESDMIGNVLKNGKHASENDISEELEVEEELDLTGERVDASHLKVNDVLPQDDLNRLSEEQLKERKAEMDVLFEANRLHPGDGGYEYDKEMDFSRPKMESGWDSDDDSSFMEF